MEVTGGGDGSRNGGLDDLFARREVTAGCPVWTRCTPRRRQIKDDLVEAELLEDWKDGVGTVLDRPTVRVIDMLRISAGSRRDRRIG